MVWSLLVYKEVGCLTLAGEGGWLSHYLKLEWH